jgi:crotonobetainyl-CoA:carnitine CoA-transferase CaiB-like acyl-CoA transferase
MSGAKVAAGKRAPALGEHTDVVLGEVGFTPDQTVALAGK